MALESIAHRGPDGSGYWESKDKTCIFGSNRLSILDLSDAALQPFTDGENALAYNGEVYNHQQLRKSFFQNFPFKTSSDTETLFHLLSDKSHSTSSLHYLEGMFAGAFYNQEEKTLCLFRDELAIKPLYYLTYPPGNIIFGSEIKALLALSKISDNFANSSVLTNYLMFENWPQGESLVGNIKTLLPGDIIKLSLNGDNLVSSSTRINKWNSPQIAKPVNESWKSYVIKCLDKTVQDHLISDVPLGSYLSGGLDSGIVTLLAARYTKDLIAFTGYFETNSYYDETPLARKVSTLAKIPLVEIKITPDHFLEHFDTLVYSLEEPRMGMGTFSQFIVAQEAAKHRKVILAGHGGDELFGGYPIFKSFYFLEKMKSLKTWKSLLSFSSNEWAWFINTIINKINKGSIYYAPILNDIKKFKNIYHLSNHKDFCSAVSENLLKSLFNYYKTVYIPGLLMAEDKISMFHSLETRFPLWSQDFLRKIENIPIEIRLKKGRLKGLYKESLSDYLPPEIIHGVKKGFPTPLRYWFKKELASEVEKRLLHSETDLYKLIRKDDLANILRTHQKFIGPYAIDEKRAHQIWIFLCLESWMRQFKVSL